MRTSRGARCHAAFAVAARDGISGGMRPAPGWLAWSDGDGQGRRPEHGSRRAGDDLGRATSRDPPAVLRRALEGRDDRAGAGAASRHDQPRDRGGVFSCAGASRPRATQIDPYLPFVRETLEQYPKLRQRGSTR